MTASSRCWLSITWLLRLAVTAMPLRGGQADGFQQRHLQIDLHGAEKVRSNGLFFI